MNRRLVRAMLAALVLAGLLGVGMPSAAAQSGADLAVTIEADRTNAKAGQLVTYTITVSNLGDATATCSAAQLAPSRGRWRPGPR